MCFTHSMPWHSGLTCAQYDSQCQHGDPGYTETQTWIRTMTKPCPNASCSTPIQKGEACFHMTCKFCFWIYLCLKVEYLWWKLRRIRFSMSARVLLAMPGNLVWYPYPRSKWPCSWLFFSDEQRFSPRCARRESWGCSRIARVDPIDPIQTPTRISRTFANKKNKGARSILLFNGLWLMTDDQNGRY